MNIKQIFTAIALTLCILSVAVIFTLNFRPLYYMDIHHFNLPEKTGYPEEEIRENYDSLIDYNSPGCSRRAHRHELGPVFYSVSQIVF